LCRTAYSPEFAGAQFAGIDSSYAFRVSPWPKMLAAEVLHFLDGLQSLSNVLICRPLRPEVAPM
jgi:hypothetical protein